VKWFGVGSSLSLFGRTFLLMVAALVIAEAIGLTLLITRPPIHNAPVPLSELAWQLAGGDLPGAAGPPGFQGGDAMRPPPPGEVGEGEGPGGPPGGPRDGAGPGGPGATDGSGGPELNVRYSVPPPQSTPGSSLQAAPNLQGLLAARLHVAADRVRVFVEPDEPAARPLPGRMGADPQLHEGFLVAFKQDSGVWRIVESLVPGFPNEFQRQAMWLFALGIALLVPPAWLFSRALVAPIRRFSSASQRLGSDTRAEPLPLNGPSEMRAAIESFNTMQARLNRLLEERTHMIGAIAHDLRTPLTRLAFRLESLPPPLGDKVNADIQEMKAMISAALDFIREQSTGGRRERLDFRLLVESVVDDQTDVGNDVTLQEGDPIVLSGDATALRRVVVNLVDNALKYGERARLRLKRQAQDCTLEVDDDGPGIPDSQQERVFQPFYRIETSRNRNTGGIGLGLATVRAIVLDHGGSIELRNRPEGGLRVTMTIPAGTP
jgi:two-component system OmpR family sensor kinase